MNIKIKIEIIGGKNCDCVHVYIFSLSRGKFCGFTKSQHLRVNGWMNIDMSNHNVVHTYILQNTDESLEY